MASENLISPYGRILSVHSESAFRKHLVDYLEDSGFTLFEASNGEEGLAVFRRITPDLVLSSLQMPVQNGLELLDAIKRESPETPVIVISGKEQADAPIEALRLGAWDYIEKPVANMAVLEHAVCRALERGRLVTENKIYRLELEKKNIQLSQSLAQLKEDQQAGRSVQEQLLPKSLVKFEDCIFTRKVLPSLYLSGDFVDYFEIDEQKIGFYIADVSGHGASSAFITVLLKSLVSQLLANYQIGHSKNILYPDRVLKLVSDELLSAKLGKYLTMIYCVLDLKNNILNYSVGGHYPSPILCGAQQKQFLKGDGFAVGIFKEANFVTQSVKLPAKFTLAMFSDGILEIIEAKTLEEKEQILLNAVTDLHLEIPDILQAIGMKNDENLPDDITVLLIHRGKV